MKYFSIVFGCQMNYTDSERIVTVLKSLEYQPAKTIDESDLLIVNMCSVRQTAVDRVYGLAPKISKLKKNNPSFRSLLTGCILPADQKKLSSFFDFVLDKNNLSSWPEALGNINKDIATQHYLDITPSYQSSFQAFVPIMTGCNYRCSYCVVPDTRHREYYRPAVDILKEIKTLAQNNYQEIWLLGQNVNHYFSTYNSKDINFSELLKLIESISGQFWLYFTSPYPSDFSDEAIITIAQSQKIAPSINLPLQSGDNEILKKMNRFYSVEQYYKLVKKIRDSFHQYRKGLDSYPSISTDIIVGFPSETKTAFQHSLQAFKDLKFDAAHIAAYSPRPNTIAASLPDQIPHSIKRKRVAELTKILRETALENNQRYLNQKISVLIEKNDISKNILLGRSFSYKTIKILNNSNEKYVGKKVIVKINKIGSWQLEGVIVNPLN